MPLGLLGAGELVGLGSVAGWGIVSRGVARWKAWGQTAAVDVFFGLEVLDSDFRLSFSCRHSILLSGCFESNTAPRDRTNNAVSVLGAPPRGQLGGLLLGGALGLMVTGTVEAGTMVAGTVVAG